MTSFDPLPWWKGAVIYHIYPRSFRDSNNDGIGDLEGVIQGLDHVASLGVDAIWLSPFYASPQKDFGYDISDYCEVDPSFGSLADFDRLIARAHALGLKVIVDQVYCHTSDEHEWFAQSRADRENSRSDWYVWADAKPDGAPPSNWQSVFGGPAWEWDARRRQYYLHNFLKEQPQLNVHNPDVQNALLDVARFWLNRGVDGFRLDAINFAMHDPALTDNPPSNLPMAQVTRPFDMQLHLHNQSHPGIAPFLERVRGVLDSYPDRFSVAEVTGEDPVPEMQRFTSEGKRLHSAYGFDFLYARNVSAGLVRKALEPWTGASSSSEGGQGWPAWAFCNHDAPRAVSRWAKPEHREAAARQYLMLLLSLRGSAFLYQGEELGLPQGEVAFEHLQDPEAIANWPRTLGRDGARTPFPWNASAPHGGFSGVEPWLPADPAQTALALDGQQTSPQSMLAFTRQTLAVRAALAALRAGSMRFLDTPEPILVFVRGDGADQVLCAFNLSDRPASWAPRDGANWRVCLSSHMRNGDQPISAELPAFGAYWAKVRV